MALVLIDGSVFLHIPKTGGTWVTKVLTDAGLVRREVSKKHADIDRLVNYWHRKGRTQLPPFVFCFVRNPIKWYESYFKYVSQPRVNWKTWGTTPSGTVGWHPCNMLNECKSDDFNEFVRNVVRVRPGYATELFGWYTKAPVHFIGKQENLREDLIRALKMRQLPFDEDALRNSPAAGVSDDQKISWDPALRELVAKLEYGGLVRYGYES
jgi:hypothetical protein